MSATYYTFYKRRIESKTETKEKMTSVVEDAYKKNRLTKKEYDSLLELIEEVYNG